MDELLKKICKEYEVDEKIVEGIINLEKKNVHKKTRPNIFGDLRNLIDTLVDIEVDS